uniref:OSJNBa0035B13.4 protein n=1 Tax=Oryza sativa subsp. japonica TaxID=39947 RepID=Q7XVU7_ORYSJ|nr:OSJNBa0035B13.4 [Oryza sativa Japonica Group]
MWLFWRSRNRFSLEELRYLTDQLQKVHIVYEANKDFVVEALRSIAELMIYGDQHDPSYFEFFMEKQIMGEFARILRISKLSRVSLQLLQTMSIMIQNLRNEHSIFELYMLYETQSCNRFSLYYMQDEVISFPLYVEALKFAFHEDSMIRVAIRTLTLNVYHDRSFLSVGDESVNRFVSRAPLSDYFSDMVNHFQKQCIDLDKLVVRSVRNADSAVPTASVEDAIVQIEDTLYYFSDVMSSGIPDLGRFITENILQLLVFRFLLPSLQRQSTMVISTGNGDKAVVCSMLYISKHDVHDIRCVDDSVVIIITKELDESMLDALGILPQRKQHKKLLLQALVGEDLAERQLFSSSSGLADDSICSDFDMYVRKLQDKYGLKCHHPRQMTSKFHRYQVLDALVALFCRSNVSADVRLVGGWLFRQLLPHGEEEFTAFHLKWLKDSHKDYSIKLLDESGGCWRDLLVPIVKEAWKNCKKGDSSIAIAERIYEMVKEMWPQRFTSVIIVLMYKVYNYFGVCKVPYRPTFVCHTEYQTSKCSLKYFEHYQQCSSILLLAVDLQKMRRTPKHNTHPNADEILYQSPSIEISTDHKQPRERTEMNANIRHDKTCAITESLMLSRSWLARWTVNGARYESPRQVLSHGGMVSWQCCGAVWCGLSVMVPTHAASRHIWLGPSAVLRSLNLSHVESNDQGFVLQRQVILFCLGETLTDQPPIFSPTDLPVNNRATLAGFDGSVPKPGLEVNLVDAVPCRIAFERGKERHFCFLALSNGTSGWILLLEELPLKEKRGIVRVTAPLAGSDPRIDEKHAKWLHLRIRPSTVPFLDTEKYKGKTRKYLVDGRWTLAFRDEQSCKEAETMVIEEMKLQQGAVGEQLKLLLEFDMPEDGITGILAPLMKPLRMMRRTVSFDKQDAQLNKTTR